MIGTSALLSIAAAAIAAGIGARALIYRAFENKRPQRGKGS